MPFLTFICGVLTFYAGQYFPVVTWLCLSGLIIVIALSIVSSHKRKGGRTIFSQWGVGKCLWLKVAPAPDTSRHFLSLVFLFFFFGVFYAYLRYQPALEPAMCADAIQLPLLVEGTLVSIPRKTQHGFKQAIRIKTIHIPPDTPTFDGTLIRDPINVFYTGPPLRPGTKISAPMTLRLSTPTINPGSYIFEPRINATIKDAEAINVQSTSPPSIMDGLLFFEDIRYTMTQAMQDTFDDSTGGFLRSITIGDMSALTEATNEDFRRTGLSHLLSISGTHFGMLFTLVFFVIRALLHRLPPRQLLKMTCYVTPSEVAATCALPVIVLYLLVSGLSVPALRSFIMIDVFLIGLLLGLRGQWINTIMFAAFIVELVEPTAIFSISFQLSFGAVFFIGLAVHRPTSKQLDTVDTTAYPPPSGLLQRLVVTLKESLLVSVAASAGTMPIVVYYFHSCSVVTVLANLIVVPYTGFIIMPLVLLSSVVFALFGRFVLVDVINWATARILDIIGGMAAIPFASINVPAFAPVFPALIYLSLFLLYRIRDKRVAWVPMLLVTLLFAGSYLYTGKGEMRIAFIDVGHGDGAVVETPGGHVVVIDTGRTGREVEDYLRYRGKDEVEAIVLSHSDNDHCGGFFRLLDKFKVHCVFDNGQLHYDYNGALDVRHLNRGDVFTIDGVSFTALHPCGATYTAAAGNEASLVLKVRGRYASVVFTGDVQRQGEEDLLAVGRALKADVLKVSHHGSGNATSAEFLHLVAPELAVISVGRGKNYGLPHRSVIARLQGTRLYRTDSDGTVLLRETAKGLRVDTYANYTLKKANSLNDELHNIKFLFAVY
ncbi:DNA internalization-like competence protein ComEC/Rec2 [Candidatus Magnetobacterium bavaricum]|uniref:DNA internalization-like competence protein ComEC/Rec2 n=1 Tax=Candidatus Magnetobacterium bavaricum TaxID=29290 RepID=A0A0F3GYM0_9BACT|nr:DNA internalization-like competence protein ComEC/Rec2 [Candidatus Magnetobacterium bavaricum]